jgi:hypothetical protein
MRKCALPARPSHELDPISAMSWGGEPVRRDQQGKSIIRMQGVYATAGEIASGKKFARSTVDLHPSECAGVDAAGAPRPPTI